MRRKLDAHPREIENCRNPPNLMVVRHYGLEVERIKQLTLLTLAPPHHRNSPSMADSPRRNHGSLCSSRQFCNKIAASALFKTGFFRSPSSTSVSYRSRALQRAV